MPILDNWNIQLLAREVLISQDNIRSSDDSIPSSIITEMEEAIVRSKTLIQPQVLYQKYGVKQLIENRLYLVSPKDSHEQCYLSGQLIAKLLSNANEVIVIICTIGRDLEDAIGGMFTINPRLATAMDKVGSYAIETLSISACNYFEIEADRQGYKTSIPLNPGMVGWPVEVGQPQVFSLLDSDQINVSITEYCMLYPSKSLSFVIGIGKYLTSSEIPCSFCQMKGVCHYKNHYGQKIRTHR